MSSGYCIFAGCAHISTKGARPECSILEKPCLNERGECTFFVTREQARQDREAVSERIKASGSLGHDGTYIQRFTRARRVEDENGKAHTEIWPDIVAWLEWLQSRDIISLDWVNNYKAKHPAEVYD